MSPVLEVNQLDLAGGEHAGATNGLDLAGGEHASATDGLDLLLGDAGEETGLHDHGLLGEDSSTQNLEQIQR